jgi:hypothetical protein
MSNIYVTLFRVIMLVMNHLFNICEERDKYINYVIRSFEFEHENNQNLQF